MLLPLHDRQGEVVAHAIVDDNFALTEQRWSLMNAGYVQGWLNGEVVLLHRVICGMSKGDPKVDHRNRNKLDCRRENLRIVTDAENSQNSERQTWRGKPVASKFRGVARNRDRWGAYARLNGRRYWLGTFDSEEEAAEVAKAWRLQNMTHSGDV